MKGLSSVETIGVSKLGMTYYPMLACADEADCLGERRSC